MWLQIPPTFCISSLKKNPAENYMAPDPANFLHQLPQKESGGKLCGSRSRQLCSSAPSKRILLTEKDESRISIWHDVASVSAESQKESRRI